MKRRASPPVFSTGMEGEAIAIFAGRTAPPRSPRSLANLVRIAPADILEGLYADFEAITHVIHLSGPPDGDYHSMVKIQSA